MAERLPSGAMTASSTSSTSRSARRSAWRPSASIPSSLVSRTFTIALRRVGRRHAEGRSPHRVDSRRRRGSSPCGARSTSATRRSYAIGSRAPPRRAESVVVDFRGVEFLAVSGLYVLCDEAQRMALHRARLTVVCTNPRALQLFRVCRLDDALDVVGSRSTCRAGRGARRTTPAPPASRVDAALLGRVGLSGGARGARRGRSATRAKYSPCGGAVSPRRASRRPASRRGKSSTVRRPCATSTIVPTRMRFMWRMKVSAVIQSSRRSPSSRHSAAWTSARNGRGRSRWA